jgi:hypothetical protein
MTVDFRGLTPSIQVFDMPTSIHFDRDVLGFAVVTASGPVPDCGWALPAVSSPSSTTVR